VQLLESVSYDGLLTYEFEYDEQNSISKSVRYAYDAAGYALTRTEKRTSVYNIGTDA
jgi:hypothetical protein